MKFLEILKQHIDKVINAPKEKTLADDFIPTPPKKKWPIFAIIAGILAFAITLGIVVPNMANNSPEETNESTGKTEPTITETETVSEKATETEADKTTEAPIEPEPTQAPTTEPIELETTEALETEPIEPAATETPAEEPTIEAPTKAHTEKPTTETPTEASTEEPTTETPTEASTEEPTTEALTVIEYTGKGSDVKDVDLPEGIYRFTCTMLSGSGNMTMYLNYGVSSASYGYEDLIFNNYTVGTIDVTMVKGAISGGSLIINAGASTEWKITVEKMKENLSVDVFENTVYSGTGSAVYNIDLPVGHYKFTCRKINGTGNMTIQLNYGTNGNIFGYEELIFNHYTVGASDVTIVNGPIYGGYIVVNSQLDTEWEISIVKIQD
jgi:hypothetical protein